MLASSLESSYALVADVVKVWLFTFRITREPTSCTLASKKLTLYAYDYCNGIKGSQGVVCNPDYFNQTKVFIDSIKHMLPVTLSSIKVVDTGDYINSKPLWSEYDTSTSSWYSVRDLINWTYSDVNDQANDKMSRAGRLDPSEKAIVIVSSVANTSPQGALWGIGNNQALTVWPSTTKETFVHELGHTLKQWHTGTDIPQSDCRNAAIPASGTGWPYSDNYLHRLDTTFSTVTSLNILNVPYDFSGSGVVATQGEFEVMGYCTESKQWLSPFSYKELMKELGYTI